MADNQIAERHYEFHSSALASDTFTVVSISGKEGLSRPYEFAVTLVAASADIDLEAVLYKDATLKIRGGEGSGASGEYRGIVTRFEQSRKVDQYVFYEARLEPKLWLLSQTYLSEVYLERTIPQLIEEILRAGGLTSLDYEIRLSSSYRVWPYVCQYQETYLAFISRLMERDGVYYYFESGAEREKLIITDALSFQTAPELKLNYRPAADLDTHVTDDAVQALVCQQQPLPATVMVKDYNYQKAALNISQSAPVSPGGVGEVILYGENVDTQAEAERVAKLRAQEIAWHGRVFHGESTAIGMRSGVFFSLARHFRSAFNTHYLPLEISHKGSQTAVLLAGLGISGLSGEQDEPFYRNEFSAIAADVQFRPARTTPWPRMDGVMNGFIDAEGSGQYAEVDQYGRYKVQLPFDKTDKPAQKASAWIRLATPYSDPRSGMHFPLRKGAEVLLAFIDGDPDRPVIVNTVPNSDNPNMVTSGNSTQNVLYTGGGNLLWMEDQEGAQNITLRTPTQDTYIALGAVTSATQGGPPWGARGDDGTLTGNHIVINTNGNGRIRIGEYLQTLVGPNSQPPSALKNGDYFQSNSNDSTQIVGGNQQSNITGYAVTNVGPHPRQSAYGAPEAGDVQFNTQK
ncbi:MAG: type VI secretion system Vgr family protein, partial [Candidatus Binataceae bacterium]